MVSQVGLLVNSILQTFGIRLCRRTTLERIQESVVESERKLAAAQAEVAELRETRDIDPSTIADRLTAHMDHLFGPLQSNFSRRHYDRRVLFEILKQLEFGFSDVLLALNHPPINQASHVKVKTDRPIAEDSLDHLEPFGTSADNTRGVGFCVQCEQLLGRKIRLLDFGCAGGGLVFDFLMRGHFAIGVEGSDFSLKTGRANWRLLKHHLFTADITHPFQVVGQDEAPLQFDVATAWEVLEHLPEEKLDAFFSNVHTHLVSGGLFVGTVNFVESPHHVCVHPRPWWEARFQRLFEIVTPLPFQKHQLPRGVNSGLFDSSDYFAQPDHGFHFCVRKK